MEELLIKRIQIDWNRVGKDSYVCKIPSVNRLQKLCLESAVTFFVGENGSGKSTLLEAVATSYGFNPEGGTLNYSFSTYDEASPLADSITLVKGMRRAKVGYFFRAETFFNVATASVRDYRGSDYHKRSHGEGSLDFIEKFDGDGLYLLDEPEAALSVNGQLSLMRHVYKAAQQGAQFIIATHSPILTGLPGARILSFSDAGIFPCEYEDTQCYRETKLFIEHREQILKALLED